MRVSSKKWVHNEFAEEMDLVINEELKEDQRKETDDNNLIFTLLDSKP